MANVIWKAKKAISGRVPLRLSAVTPLRNILSSPPQKELASPKAIEYPAISHSTDINAAMAAHCMKTLSTLRARTRPP